MVQRLLDVKQRYSIKAFALSLVLFWTAAIVLSLLWSVRNSREALVEQARLQARTVFQKDTLFRQWATQHGGVYVPVSDQTPPTPYLAHIPDRDIVTPSGTPLTLINPAYIMRQVNELAAQRQDVFGHLTSLNPLRPENIAYGWEVAALTAFEAGETEFVMVHDIAGEEYMSLMRPFVTEEGCLKCHAQQGYQVGDIRGGVSVSVPMAPFWGQLQATRQNLLTVHGLLWLLGMLGVAGGSGRLLWSDRQRQQAENALQHSLQTLEARVKERTVELEKAWDHISSIIQSTPDVMLVTDLQKRIILLNRRAETFFGKTFAELFQTPLGELFGDTALAGNVEAFMTGDNGDVSLFDRERNEVRSFQLTVSAVQGSAEQQVGHILNLRDVTLARESDRLKSEFIMTAAHELSTPLAAVMGYAEFMLSPEWRQMASEAQQREFLSIIYEKSAHLGQIVDELLLLSRLESGRKINLEMGYCDIWSDLRRQVDQFRHENPGHRFELILPEGEQPLVWCDRGKVGQVVENLLTNAVKYSPPESLVRVVVAVADGHVRFTVVDQGIGMTADVQRHVFEKFYRADNSNTAVGGLGLGMTIVKNIVDGHQGQIHIDSTPGCGTRVTFTLPRITQAAPSPPPAAPLDLCRESF